jgi:histidinol phosphatase-like enzyme (inositol monophosphatase family)
MPLADRDSLLEFMSATLQAAGALTLEHFGRAAVSLKQDGSEVTAADLAAEAYIRQAISERFPEDGILGEEGEDRPSRSGRRWVVDPIDGTRSFAAGVPLYAVLMALEVDGHPVLGGCHLPVTRETLVAATGAGAWLNGRRARVSECETLADARVVTSGLEYWRDRGSEAHRAGFERLVRDTRYTRTWGDGFGYLQVACGRAEILIDPICGAHWDIAPMRVIIPEAGGRITTIDGEPIGEWSSLLAASPALHAAARESMGRGS